MLDTLARAKALNPALSGVFYLNTLMAFPFYALSGKFADAEALLVDMYTGKPVALVNDEGMKDVWVYDWGQYYVLNLNYFSRPRTNMPSQPWPTSAVPWPLLHRLPWLLCSRLAHCVVVHFSVCQCVLTLLPALCLFFRAGKGTAAVP